VRAASDGGVCGSRVDASLPCFGRCGEAESLTATAPRMLALSGSQRSGGDLPRFPAIGAITGQQVDPFLTWFDVWSEGALGQLRDAAIEASTNNDTTAYRKLAVQYWSGVAVATERRRLLVAKSGDGATGPRVTRRTGQ